MARHRVGQAVIGVLQAGPGGVAPEVGAFEHVEDRSEGRLLEESDVGMPPAGPVNAPVDGQHVGVLVKGRDHRMAFGDCAELRGEIGLLGRREFLVTEEDHVVGVEGGPNLSDRRFAQRRRQVDPVDLRSDDGREGAYVQRGGDGHCGLSMTPVCPSVRPGSTVRCGSTGGRVATWAINGPDDMDRPLVREPR